MKTLGETKKKVLGLIEELNPNSPVLTDDEDIATKFNYVANIILFEMARYKKIPKYAELPVEEGQLLTFDDIEKAVGYEIYQLDKIRGVNYASKANGTVFKMLESGTAEIEVFVYPESITEKTKDSYEFEVSPDVLEVMVYGIAGDLLKSDVSSGYGAVYTNRYESMKQMLDPRYQVGSIRIEGGVDL